ncbi:LOW QUALITY PROTEIN: hypothetical protein PHMEG_00010167 [Phytophthora megakarya]|uniref:Uncharacterized protein n=1 Tax=Phytophthora megakarya TaxID=4795 RepID=A0A225WED3_9STRA|nr:LOW QUALITY PROTEIN: hypothetical protein PHMEG_00010167 [Phytophthora megakarya]
MTINDKEFTSWSAKNKALSLLCDTMNGTLSIPAGKLDKSNGLITVMPRSSYCNMFSTFMGLVLKATRCMNIYPVIWELSRIYSGFKQSSHNKTDSTGCCCSICKYHHPIAHGQECVFEPPQRYLIRVQYSHDETQMIQCGMNAQSINVRELCSAVFVALHWRPSWQQQKAVLPVHVCIHIDNMNTLNSSTNFVLSGTHTRETERNCRCCVVCMDEDSSTVANLDYVVLFGTVFRPHFGGFSVVYATPYGAAMAETFDAKYNSDRMWFHRRYSDIDLVRSHRLRLVLQDSTQKQLPVTPALLRLLPRSLNLVRLQDRLLWGSILLTYSIPKVAYFTNSHGNPVTPEFATDVSINLPGTKNDQLGRVRALKPLLQAHCDLGVINHGYIYVDLTSEKVSSVLKNTAIRSDVEKSKYS